MDHKNKLLELLQNKNLNEIEKQELDELLRDDDLKEFALTYYNISDIVKNSSHIDEETLADYVLYKNGLDPEDKSVIKKIPFIQSHLRNCLKCNELFKELSSEYSDADTFITASISVMKLQNKKKLLLRLQV